jgi:hypothetical protein
MFLFKPHVLLGLCHLCFLSWDNGLDMCDSFTLIRLRRMVAGAWSSGIGVSGGGDGCIVMFWGQM